jgi:hypothetical protein
MSGGQTPGERRGGIFRRFFALALWQQVVGGLIVLAIAALVAAGYRALVGASPPSKPTTGISAPASASTSGTSSPAPSPVTSSTAASSDITVSSAVAEHGFPGMSSDQFDVVLSTLQNSGSLSVATT